MSTEKVKRSLASITNVEAEQIRVALCDAAKREFLDLNISPASADFFGFYDRLNTAMRAAINEAKEAIPSRMYQT